MGDFAGLCLLLGLKWTSYWIMSDCFNSFVLLFRLLLAVNFINVKHANFLYKSLFKAKMYLREWCSYEKFVRQTLMKLTLGRLSFSGMENWQQFLFNLNFLLELNWSTWDKFKFGKSRLWHNCYILVKCLVCFWLLTIFWIFSRASNNNVRMNYNISGLLSKIFS